MSAPCTSEGKEEKRGKQGRSFGKITGVGAGASSNVGSRAGAHALNKFSLTGATERDWERFRVELQMFSGDLASGQVSLRKRKSGIMVGGLVRRERERERRNDPNRSGVEEK
ncbi:Hypothetical protein NTJ_05141 [Nesidiocoris tenuis]|uniref:Uncharacterized protein n=1 Tax=Nesidiocoris tenuis TaxID=355587 RepID=A0ABN7AK49_9HEMI|nr:Hypothetical protein NTJ_05141 [Nesidiocoris tenuis]